MSAGTEGGGRPPGGRAAHWETVYAEHGETGVSWYQARPEVSLSMIEAAGIGPEDAIIDVGGGASRLVDHLLAAGYRNVAVLDIADRALRTATARLGPQAGRVDWIVADVTAWRPSRRFALWHDRAVFHFLTEAADRRAYVRTMDAALAPDGQAIIATFAPDAPPRCSGLPVVRYDAETIVAELGTRFRLIEQRREAHRTPAGRLQPFHYFRFARAG